MPKNPKGKSSMWHELEEDAEYKGLSDEKNVPCPSTGEMISEKEYMRRFNNEWYYAARHGKHKIITSDSGKKETYRNNNMNNRDALSYAARTGKLEELKGDERIFMQAASDEWEWQDVYKILGPEHAQYIIFEQAKRDILDDSIELDTVLSQFIVKMMKLKTFNERRRKQGSKDEK